MSEDRASLASQVAQASLELHRRGWVANHDGNISVRLADDRFMVTPTAMSKADVVAEGLAVADGAGQVAEGALRPPSEFALHLGAYSVRPDIRAVVHAHPPYATALACTGRGIKTFLAEAVVSLGPEVPVTAFALPYGDEGAAPIRDLMPRFDALLLCQHGVITVGPSVELALLRMELVEHMARIQTLAVPHGGVKPLPDEILPGLIAKRRKAGLGLAAERTPDPTSSEAERHESPQLSESPVPASGGASEPQWTPAGPAPARDAWSGGASEATCGVVYGSSGAGSQRSATEGTSNAELTAEVEHAIKRHLS
ncbi:MAG: aldolase [Deltaproteobacteria bacterium]|nr:aldolase [Deltaproteobacteria bacterium]